MIEKLTDIKGIGEKRADALSKLGVSTPMELLRLSPRRYMDFTNLRKLHDAENGEVCAYYVRAISAPRYAASVKGMKLVTCRVEDESGSASLTWFNQTYMVNAFHANDMIYLYGRMDIKASSRRIASPVVYKKNPFIVPVYPLKRGISQSVLLSAMKACLSSCKGFIEETLPQHLIDKYDLMPLENALFSIHFPQDSSKLAAAKRRLAFEDMLLFRLAVNYIRIKRKKQAGISFNTNGCLKEYSDKLPFTLTDGQKTVIHDITNDMNSPHAMNRLVQGDVGSGKTAVAMYAMFVAVKNGMQAVLVAPTEILAKQHYDSLCKIVDSKKVCLLTGSMTKKEKTAIYSKIADGTYKYITGTHALLQPEVKFSNIGIVVCDEQQRFGVQQRAVLQQKGLSPDVLVMSATPIPRTLAIVLYGDLDVSQIKEMPKNRRPVKTRIVPQDKRLSMYRYIEDEAISGKPAYVVCPQIENDSDDYPIETVKEVYSELCSLLSVKIGLLHGKMKSQEKTDAIESFRSGETKILVSTTVIEVGVDIPGAVNMVIESADRFGLSQLHQLRGRIGRGSLAGYCFLLSDRNSGTERLRALASSSDGFKIAEKDLELRGPGQFLGSQQHGASELAMLCLAGDISTLSAAKEAADDLMMSQYSEKTKLLLECALSKFDISVSYASFN